MSKTKQFAATIAKHPDVIEVEDCYWDSEPYRYRVVLRAGKRWKGYRTQTRSFERVSDFLEAVKYGSIEDGKAE